MFMENQINLLNNEIITGVLCGNYKLKVYNKAKLLKKYNRRLKLILY